MPTSPRADAHLPTGTVTFLFTDIEGSTTLWEQNPEAMQDLLARHDGTLRDAIESNGGCIVKSMGDGVHAAFAVAGDALAAGVALQRALQGAPVKVTNHKVAVSEIGSPIPLKVRIGIHTGPAEQRDGDYFGSSVNRAARIMSVAHGEQLLLSAATEELVRRQMPEGVTLRDMGDHRLKGLLNPERLLQVVAPGLRADFPPLASFNGRHSLPAERDAFVGRREPLLRLQRRFDDGARLVSVLGLGGTGKTRLVTRYGWDTIGKFPGGTWFCDLSQARSLDGIVHAVAQGLDLPLGKDDPVTQIGTAIAGRGQCLVILDNFEQVARYAEETLGRWLDRASTARFLVTTREVLGLAGEEVLALAPLSSAEAMTLFVRRAVAAKPEFQPNADDQAAIAPLVKLLEGMPLAIELAAARVRVMPPRTLLARMTERFKLLSSAGGRVDRQATLRAVFDWSWDLLSTPEKAALAQLSVFEGGFTLDSVEAILDLSAYESAPWPMDALQSLVHKSFVREVADSRFDLLVSVQEYASEHLRTEGRYSGSGVNASHAMEVRHGAYFSGLDEDRATGEGIELDNFVVACRRATVRRDCPVAVNALERAWAGLRSRGPFRVGSELVSMVRATPGLGDAELPLVDWVAGRVLMACGKDDEARVELESSLARARDMSNRRCECRALIALGALDSHAGRMETARGYLEAALTIARDLKDRPLQSDARNGLGNIDHFLGRMGESRVHFEAGLALARDLGDRQREGDLLGNLGTVYFDEGRADESRSHNEAALQVAREMGNRRLEGNTLCNLGLLHQVQGRFTDALDQLEAGLEVARDLGHRRLECVVLCNLGMVYDSLTRFDEARDHFEAALVVARDLGDRRSEGQFLSYLGLLHARQGSFDEARHCLDAGETLLHAVSDQMSLGILLCSRAEMEHLAGSPDRARAKLADAGAIAASVGAGLDSELGLALARLRALLGPSGIRESTVHRPDSAHLLPLGTAAVHGAG